MKTFLSVVLVVVMAAVAYGQPPKQGKFGAGKGKFGDPAKMAEVRKQMMERWQGKKSDVAKRRPGPPPWAGKDVRGPRGPQHPFWGKAKGPHKKRPDFRRGGSKGKVSGHHRGHRRSGWQHRGRKFETDRRGFKKPDYKRYHKGRDRKGCKACQNCPCKKR